MRIFLPVIALHLPKHECAWHASVFDKGYDVANANWMSSICSSQATEPCTATLNGSGGVQLAITYAGQYTTAATGITTSFTTSGTPAAVTLTQSNTQGITLECNQNKISMRVSGAGTGGAVTSVLMSFYLGLDAQVGGNFTVSTCNATTGGSGTGLQVDIQAVGSLGGIASLGVTSGNAGTGYTQGDIVYLPVSGVQYAGGLNGVLIGGGLAIGGAFYRGISISNDSCGASAPITAAIDGVSINGVSTPTPIAQGVYGNANSIVAIGTVTDVNVAAATAGSYTPVSTTVSSTFTPTAVGWYRLIAAASFAVSGSFDIKTSAYDNHENHTIGDFTINGYGGTSSVSVRTPGAYGGSYGPITQIQASSDNTTHLYLDIYVADVTSAKPISVTYAGNSLPQGAIQTTPATSTPGSYSIANYTYPVSTLSTNAANTARATTGVDQAYGYIPTGLSASTSPLCYKTTGGPITNSGCSTGGLDFTSASPNLRFPSDGSEGAYSCTSGTCNLSGEHWYASFSVSAGTIVVNNTTYPLIIRATGACTIAGTVSVSPNTGSAAGNYAGISGLGGGSGGGGGGGTASGTPGNGNVLQGGGSAGAAAGGTGGNGNATPASGFRDLVASGFVFPTGLSGNVYGDASGGAGGSSGPTGGKCGGAVSIVCTTINFSGAIDASGAAGANSTANNIGASGGGGGGIVLTSAVTYSANTGTINVSGGAGGSCLSYTGCGTDGAGASGSEYQATIQ